MAAHTTQHGILGWQPSFPYNLYPEILPTQEEALDIIAREPGSVALELPTGSGKTAIGYTFLKAYAESGAKTLFYIVPNKALVDQVLNMHPDMQPAYGRGEHPCLYFGDEEVKADEIPCSLLTDCPHRVDQETGETFGEGAVPCPYLKQKYEAKKRGGMIVCTAAFYLFTQLFSREWPTPDALVIDEAHRIARIVRGCLSFEISDFHLQRAIELLERLGTDEYKPLKTFRRAMIRICRKKSPRTPTILEDDEIKLLISHLEKIDGAALTAAVGSALAGGLIDAWQEREVLKQLEVLSRDIKRYINSLGYSVPKQGRNPLNYTYAYYTEEREEGKRKQYRLFIRSYYVAPIVKLLLSPRTVAYSATIGDPQVFKFETGIDAPFHGLSSRFPAVNTRIFVPTDTPNLAFSSRSKQEPSRVLRRIARACRRFADKGIRSLVVVVSEAERAKCMERCESEGVSAVSYGNGIVARDAVARFKDGEGDVLVGTVAQFGEGVDLPRQVAPVIFFLRPGYASPRDPATVYEERRFRGQCWALWNWRVMIEALQVRGRNIRSADDLGVTFFVSQQFRRFVRASLPDWLGASYRGKKTFDACIEEAEALLETIPDTSR